MKKFLSVLLTTVILITCVATMVGCATQHTIELYVGEELFRTLRADSGGNAPYVQPASVAGFKFLGWYDEATEFDFSKPVNADYKLKAKFYDATKGEVTEQTQKLDKIDLKGEFAEYAEFGKVNALYKTGDTYYFEVYGYYGYHLDENPSMLMGVAVDAVNAEIIAVTKLDSYKQTEGYPDFITQSYLDKEYKQGSVTVGIEAQPSTGATATSTAVIYAVRTACYYMDKAFGIVADTSEAEKAELSLAYKAEYSTIKESYAVDSKLGTVLYAASGVGEDGTEVVGLKIKSSRIPNKQGADAQGWDSEVPNAYTLVIIVNKATNKVIATNVLIDGSRAPQYFAVTEEKLASYNSVTINGAEVFDDFKDGLMFDLGYDTNPTDDGEIITGTSILYSGATVDGSYSSQFVRNCFRALARFYTQYVQSK